MCAPGNYYSKGNYEEIKNELNKIDWDVKFQEASYDVDEVWALLSNKIKELRDKYIPIIYINSKRKKKPVVLNDSILHLTRLKRFYYKKYKKNRNMIN